MSQECAEWDHQVKVYDTYLNIGASSALQEVNLTQQRVTTLDDIFREPGRDEATTSRSDQ